MGEEKVDAFRGRIAYNDLKDSRGGIAGAELGDRDLTSHD